MLKVTVIYPVIGVTGDSDTPWSTLRASNLLTDKPLLKPFLLYFERVSLRCLQQPQI